MAHAALGGSARLPTVNDITELRDNCSVIWTTLDGVYGSLFTSNINGQILFMPAAGCYNGTSLLAFGTSGHYWSSIWNSAENARHLWLQQNSISPSQGIERAFGCSVRPVWDPNI